MSDVLGSIGQAIGLAKRLRETARILRMRSLKIYLLI